MHFQSEMQPADMSVPIPFNRDSQQCPPNLVYVANLDALMQSAHVDGTQGCACISQR